MPEEKETVEISWLNGCLDVENNLGFLDDIDFAAMLLELEYR